MSTEHQMQYTFRTDIIDYFLNALYVDIIKRFIGNKHKNAAVYKHCLLLFRFNECCSLSENLNKDNIESEFCFVFISGFTFPLKSNYC